MFSSPPLLSPPLLLIYSSPSPHHPSSNKHGPLLLLSASLSPAFTSSAFSVARRPCEGTLLFPFVPPPPLVCEFGLGRCLLSIRSAVDPFLLFGWTKSGRLALCSLVLLSFADWWNQSGTQAGADLSSFVFPGQSACLPGIRVVVLVVLRAGPSRQGY